MILLVAAESCRLQDLGIPPSLLLESRWMTLRPSRLLLLSPVHVPSGKAEHIPERHIQSRHKQGQPHRLPHIDSVFISTHINI